MKKYLAYTKNYYACDFETLTQNSQLYREFKETRVWLAYAKKFCPNGGEIELEDVLTTNIEDFFDFFFSKKESANLFFHNLSWDGEFIKWYLVRNGYEYFTVMPKRKTKKGFTIIEDDKKIYFINVFKPVRDGKKIKIVQLYIRCSLNLLVLSIDALGKTYGVETKKSINYDVDGWEKVEDVPQEFIDYIKADVNIMIKPLQQYNEVFRTRHGNRTLEGLSKLTISSTSLQMFKTFSYGKYNFKEEFFLPQDLIMELKEWYCGGLTTYCPNYHYNLTEDINGKVYDVNSMYPSVMHDNVYPIGAPEKTKKDATYNIHLVKIFIEEAKIKNPNYPALMRPWRSLSYTYEKHARYVHYTQDAIAYYFTDELESLKRFYDIKYKVIDEWWFKGEAYFKDYIKKYYNMRREYKIKGDRREQTIKILLNSAYGKFGQKPDRGTLLYSKEILKKGDSIFVEKNEYIVDVVREKENCFGELKSYICYPKESPNKSINLTIAACVCKNARIKLHDAIYANLDTFLYCDTDSVFLRDEAKGLELDDNKLGAWKLEAEFDGFELGGAKLYNLYLRGAVVKAGHCGINKKWAEENLKKYDIITVDKVLDKGAKLKKMKVTGGMVLDETEFTIKKRG